MYPWEELLQSCRRVQKLHRIDFQGARNQYTKYYENLSLKPSLGSYLKCNASLLCRQIAMICYGFFTVYGKHKEIAPVYIISFLGSFPNAIDFSIIQSKETHNSFLIFLVFLHSSKFLLIPQVKVGQFSI